MVTVSSKAFSAIESAVVNGSKMVTEIAGANEDQRRGVAQISSAMARETAGAASNMSSQVQANRAYIEELAEIVGAPRT